MKILITGGEGFIGHRISLELVRRGHQVLVIDQTQDWVRVSLPDDKQGWVAARHVVVVSL